MARLVSPLSPLIFRVRPPRWFVRRYLLGADAPLPLFDLFYSALSTVPPRVLQSRLLAILKTDLRAELGQVSVPLLYIRASRDRIIPPSAATIIRQSNPTVRIETIDSPHFVLQRHPSEAIGLIEAFLNGGQH
jgi:pimeloyl-ACP methyl ester carboxylesterase